MAAFELPTNFFRGSSDTRRTMIVAALALLPMIVLSIFAQHYSSSLEHLAPVDLTNLRAIRTMLRGALQLTDRGDSWLPMREALAILHGDHPDQLYEALFFGRSVRFQYPPTSLLPLDALSVVGLSGLRSLSMLNLVIYCVNAAGVGIIASILFGTQKNDGTQLVSSAGAGSKYMTALAVIAALMFYPLVRAEVLGQIQIWIDALFTIAIICWLSGNRFAAGICIGIACAIKPQFRCFWFGDFCGGKLHLAWVF